MDNRKVKEVEDNSIRYGHKVSVLRRGMYKGKFAPKGYTHIIVKMKSVKGRVLIGVNIILITEVDTTAIVESIVQRLVNKYL